MFSYRKYVYFNITVYNYMRWNKIFIFKLNQTDLAAAHPFVCDKREIS